MDVDSAKRLKIGEIDINNIKYLQGNGITKNDTAGSFPDTLYNQDLQILGHVINQVKPTQHNF